MNVALLEVAANSVASALAAQAGGAGRVELCASLDGGGVTPSHATIMRARDGLAIPLYVLIRPRAGDFVYTDIEIEVMLHDIETALALGCDGVVIGALDRDGNIDVARCRTLIDAARALDVTFHRAFDVSRDPSRSLEDLVALGCRRVLTSGARANAQAGAASIRRLVEQAGARIAVMPGGGIDAGNVAALRRLTGAREFHASAKRRRPSLQPPGPAELADLAGGELRTDRADVAALVAALRATAA